jgi:hypothetical protein
MREHILQGFSKYTWLFGLLVLLSLLAAATPAFPQAVPDTTIAAALSNLAGRAATVFAGEVTAVRPLGGVVEVDFRVDQSIKGQPTGAVILREWSGLWAAGQRRYWVGERAVVFLHQAGADGLSTSVDGMEGILPLTPDATSTLSVDVQRIRTRVLRDAGAPMVSATGRMSLAAVTTAVVGDPIFVPVIPPILRPRPILSRPMPIRPVSTILEQPNAPF